MKVDSRKRPVRKRSVFVVVFLMAFTIGGIISIITGSLAAKTYAGATRTVLKLKSNNEKLTRAEKSANWPTMLQTEIKVIKSEAVLKKAITAANLNVAWGEKYFDGETLKTWETMEILKSKIDAFLIPNTTMIRIVCFDDNPTDAAYLANTITAAYVDYSTTNTSSPTVQIVDSAHSLNIPFRDPKWSLMLKGIAISALVGTVLGLGMAFILHQADTKEAEN